MNNIKQQVLEDLIEMDKPLTLLEMSNIFEIEITMLEKIINDLVNEKKVTVLKKNRFIATKYLTGILKFTNTGKGYIEISKNEKIIIDETNTMNAKPGSLVSVEIIKSKTDPKEGKVVEILSSIKKTTVGEVVTKNKELYVKYETKKEKIYVKIDEKFTDIVNGHRVIFEKGKLIKDNIYDGSIISIIGHKDDPKIDVISKAISYGIATDFNQDVMKYIETIPNFVSEEEKVGRFDLTSEEIFTIDGDTAKDFDDAVSIKKLDNGHYILGVHIANVSYYVKRGSIIDNVAYDRSNSVYLANFVIPMLDHKLSNGICSLNEGVDRLTKTCIMEFDENGELFDYSIKDSVINSKKRMTYDKVNEVLSGNCPDDYKCFEKSLFLMNELAHKLRKIRFEEGSIDFETDESEIIFDAKNKPVDIVYRYRGEAERLIEEFMLAANNTVSMHLFIKKLPSVYRVHDIPNIDRVRDFMKFLTIMKEKTIKIPHKVKPKFIQEVLVLLKKTDNFKMYAEILLQSMTKASYSIENSGHFGLALECYTHFTSPIRRYSDLVVHRLLDLYDSPDFDRNKLKVRMLENYLDEVCKQTSMKERNTDLCERDVFKMYAAEYMESRIGCEYEGVIHALCEHGIYINIYNGVKGYLECSNVDKTNYSVTINGKKYKLGDPIKVKVINASKEISIIDVDVCSNEKVLKKTI